MATNRETGEPETTLIEQQRLFCAYARSLNGEDPAAAREAFEAYCHASGFDPGPLLPSHGWEYLR